VRLVITDTGPVNYLILIGSIDLLPRLFDRVVLPSTVQKELSHPKASALVRQWIANPPSWLEIFQATPIEPASGVDEGEAAVISLATALHPDLLLMDDRRGRVAAESKGFRVTGTLGVLDLAAECGLLVFAHAITALERTSFRFPAGLVEMLLAKHKS
jgi:predicted nucleic acid-binding protein